MKKTILISIGALILLLVIGVWIYLVMHGAPKNSDEVFARFGFGGEEEIPSAVSSNEIVDVQTVSEGLRQNLRQLTLRPVAGAAFTKEGIRYVEQGTGHIYDIDLETGEETLSSGTTIPGTRDALFSNDSVYVAITAYDTELKTLVGVVRTDTISGGSFDGMYLPSGATEIYFAQATGTLRYVLKDKTGSTGYSYDIEKDSGAQLFAIPLRDVHVLWGTPNYVYTTPTATQRGYLYRLEGNDLQYTLPGGFGLMAILYGNGVLITRVVGKETSTSAYTDDGELIELPFAFVTEKCTPDPIAKNSIYCSSPYNFGTKNFPDDWYKGVISYSDILWRVDLSTSESVVLSNFLEESGREIDVSKIGTDETGGRLYFINKNDNTLWMFDTTI